VLVKTRQLPGGAGATWKRVRSIPKCWLRAACLWSLGNIMGEAKDLVGTKLGAVTWNQKPWTGLRLKARIYLDEAQRWAGEGGVSRYVQEATEIWERAPADPHDTSAPAPPHSADQAYDTMGRTDRRCRAAPAARSNPIAPWNEFGQQNKIAMEPLGMRVRQRLEQVDLKLKGKSWAEMGSRPPRPLPAPAAQALACLSNQE